jgi:V/A-type H+/Na+-transporting ATPase subunit E
MHHKLKELTEKIHREGFEKANEDSARIIETAHNEAEAITRDAEKRAEKIVQEAKKQAEENARKVEAEVRLSSQQALINLKKEISELIQAGVLKEPINQAFDDHHFIRNILETLVGNWNPCTDETDLHLMVPQEQLAEMDAYLKERSGRIMNKGLNLDKYTGSGKGFEIQPSNGHYKINVTDEAFESFLDEHFKPKTLEFLYGGRDQ